VRVIGYVRASTDKQDLSPEAQEKALRDWASLTGAQLVGLEADRGVSGAAELDKRPGLLRAIERIGEGRDADELLILRRDRLARSVIQACAIEALLERQGGRVRCVDGAGNGDDPSAILIRQILDSFAQYERAIIALRTTAAMQRKIERGEYTGGRPPYGWKVGSDGRTLVPNAFEREIVGRIQAARERGMSYRTIASSLNEQGTPARGKKWYLRTVQNITKIDLDNNS
jgi:DNA invertase Pin-like site-specific DNA recombinase